MRCVLRLFWLVLHVGARVKFKMILRSGTMKRAVTLYVKWKREVVCMGLELSLFIYMFM